MSLLIREKRLVPLPIAEKAAEARPTVDGRPRPPEAPDAGDRGVEASEARLGRHYDAPDSGEGRSFVLENQFSHGRSRS